MLGGKHAIHIFQGSGCNYSIFFGGQFVHALTLFIALLVAQTVKSLSAMQETWVWSLGLEDILEKGMATHSIFLPGESHGQRSLMNYSPWGLKESDTTEWLTLSLYICQFYIYSLHIYFREPSNYALNYL